MILSEINIVIDEFMIVKNFWDFIFERRINAVILFSFDVIGLSLILGFLFLVFFISNFIW